MASREKRRPYVRWRPCVSVLFLLSLVQLGRAIHLPGTDSSYARFPKWNACINASIMFEFKSTKDNTLLMYTDDGGTYDYFELRLQNGRVHLRLNIVNGTDTSTEIIRGHNLIDGEWHRVEIRRKRMETTLIVDGESESKTSYGTDFYFGSLKTNSPVYVGGVPLDYITNLHKLALASVAFENHFKGSIQNVMYSNCSCQTVRADYVAGIEVQQFPPEACERRNPCKDGCVCISKNDEPYCDCSGIQCVKGSVTHYHLPMDYVIGTYLVNPSGLDSTAFGRPKATRGIISRAQNMNTRNQYIKVSGPGHRYECLGDLDLCQLGYTLGFWVKFEGNSHKDHEGIYLSNGGHSPRSHGVAMYYKDGNLRFKFKRKNGQEWTASSDNVLLGRWYHVAVTWGLQKGLFLYINGRQVGRDINPTTKTQGTLDKNLNEFYIGRPNDGSGTQNYGNMVVDEFHFWSIFKTAEDIREIGPFYNYILPMDARKGEQFQYSNVPVTIQGSPNIVPGQIGNAVDLNGRREYISLGELPGSCLSDLEKCIYGLTMAMWIKFTDLKENTYYIDTGNKGFKLYYKNGKLHADFQRGLNWWTTSWDGVQKDRWYFLELSWDPQEGIEMFVDQNSVAYSEDLEKREPKTSTIDNSVYIGRANTNMRSERFAAATIDDLELWYGDRGRLIDFDFIQRGRPKMHTFPMDIIQGNLLVTPTLFATVDGYPRLVGGKMKKALELNGVNQYVTVKDQNDNCLGNVNLCPHGFLISFWIKPGEFKNKMQYIATGVNGVTLIYDQGKLNARVATSAQQWEASTDKLKTDTWYFAELSWSPRTGIKLLLDDKMVAHDAKSEARAFPSGYSYNPDNDKFYIGRSNEDMTGKAYGNLTLDEMDIWFGNRDYLLAHNYIQRGRPTRIYLDMDAIQGRRLVHPNMKIDLFGNPVLVPGKANSALKLNGNSQYLDAGKSGDRCLGDLSRCPHGYTFSTWAKFDNLQDDTYYMSTGNKGVNMFYKNGMLHVTFNQPGKEWKTSVRGVQPDKWYFIEATWHPDHGAQMYFDNKLVSYITGPMRVPPKRATQNNHFYVGRANSGDTQNGYYKYPSATFDDFEIWYLNREDLLAFNYIQRDYVPHYTIPFETLQGDKILHPLFNMHLHNGAFLADGRFGKALNLNGQRQYVDLGDQSNNCIGNLDRCNHGLTTSFHIYPRELHDDTYILAGGPYSVYQKNGKTVVEYKTKTKTWTISTDKLKPKQWQQVEISWHPERGLGMYLNKTRVAFTKEFTTREASPVSNDYRIYVGKTSDMRNRNYLNGMVDEIEYWTAPREFIVANNMWPKDVKVGEILDMDNIVGNLMAHAQRPVRVYGNPTVVQGEINKAVDFDGRGQYLDLGQNVTCKGNLLKCTRGFTLRFRIKPKEFREKMYYFSGVPLDVYFRNGKLRADFYTPTHKWSVGSSDLSLHQWYLVDLSWDPANGLSMYIDGKSADSNMMPSLNEDVYNPDRRFYIGRANTPMTDEKYANAVIDDVELWDAKRDILIGESLIAADGSDPKVTPVQPADKVLIFDGRSWVTYDASKLPPEFLRQNNREQFHMQFKTRKPNGVLWYTGNDDRNMFLSLKNGQLVLGVEYGDGKTPDVFPIRYPKGRLDDGRLHNVIITRDGQRISVDVDGVKDDNFLRGDINIVGSGNIYIGGSSNPSRDSNYQVNTNFEGTVQKVLLKGDSFPRDFNLLDETYRSPRPGYIYLIGDVGMTDLGDNNGNNGAGGTDGELPSNYAITIAQRQAFIRMPRWDVRTRGKISFTLRTVEPHGLILYSGGTPGIRDFIALELIDGLLSVVINTGSGPVRLTFKDKVLNDGRPHDVQFEKIGRHIKLVVDSVTLDHTLPGRDLDNTLDLNSFLFLGGYDLPSRLPWYLWTKNPRFFVGCISNLRINGGDVVDLMKFARSQNILGIIPRCVRMPQQCPTMPCYHGTCSEQWEGYFCDCSGTFHTGQECQNDAPIIGFDGTSRVRVNFTPHISTHRDDVSLRFRTPRENGLLFSTSRLGSNKYLRVMLENGRAKMVTNLGGETTTKYSGENLDDDDWHTVYLRRRGNEMEIWVDDEEKAKFKLPGSGFDMDLDEIVVGAINEKQNPDERFVGHMTNFIYNKRKFFELLDLNNLPKGVFRGEKSLSVNEATFRSNVDSHTTLPGLQFPTNSKMSFMFKTKEPNGLIFFNKGTGDEYIAIELVDGLLHFLVDAGNGPKTKVADTPSKLNNNEWHKVSFTRTSMSDFRIKVDDSVSNLDIGSGGSRLAILGNLYVGGVPSQKMKELPALVASKRGYAGCLASLKVNRKLYNLLTDSSTTSRNILSGCRSVDSLDHCIGVTCGLGGACISTPDTFMCDCNMTAQVGTVCRNEAEGYRYGLNEGKGYFEYGLREQRNTNLDKLAFGFKTWYKNGSLVRIDGAGNEYIIVKLVNGHVVLMYDIGDGEHVLTESSQTYNDGEFHAVRFTRYGANGTLIVDSYPAIVQKHKSSVGIFNNQDMVKLGGNRINGKIQDAFNGILAGVYFNGMRFIDLAQGKVINPYIEGDVRVARHPFFLPRPSIKPGPVVTVKPPVVVPSKKPPPPPVEPVVPPGKGKVGVAWTPVGKGDGVVVVASNGVGGAGSTASGGAGAAGGAGTGGGAVAGGTGDGVVAAAVAAPAGPGVVEPGARGGVVAGSFLAVLALVSSAIWAFYKCKPGVCPFGGGGGGGGGGGAGGMSISAPRAATNFSLVRAQGMGAGGGGSYGRGAGGGASASSTLVTANASNGKAGAGGAGAGGMSQFNEYFSSMTTSSMTANSVGGGSAAGGGGVATAVVSVHDAGVQVGGGSGVGNAAASGMSVTRTAVYETVTISGGAAGGGGKSAHVATQADTLGLGRLAWGKYGMGFDTLSSKNSVTLVSDGQSYSGAGYHTGGGGGSVSSAQFSSMQRDADMTSQTTTHVRDQSISSADQLSMGGGGYAYSTASSAGVQTGGQTTGYDSMSSNQVSTGVQAEMNGRAGGTGYGDSLNVMQSSSFSSYKSESYSTAMQGGGGGADSQAFAYRAGSPYGFDGSVASSAGGAGGTYRMQSMVLNTGGLLGVAAGSRATSPVPYMTDEIKVDCVLMTADGNYAITGSGCGPPQIWDLRSGELIRVMRSHDLGSTDLHLASGDSLLVGQVSTEATQADVTETQTGAKISNRKLQIWDFATGKPLEMSDAVVFSASCLMRDGEKMVLGRTEKFGNGTSIVVWDLLGNQAVREMHYDAAIGFADSINYLNISRDSRYVIAGFQNSYDGNANFIVFDMSVHTNNIVDPKILALDAVSECTAVLDNHEAVTGTRKGELLIWSMKTGKALRQLISASGYNTLNRMGMPSAAAHASEVKAVDVSHDGKFLISASADSTLKVWNLETEKLVHTLRGHTDEVWCCTISHDNDLIVSGSRDGTIRVWRMNSGAQICLFTAGVDVFSAKISSDKHTVVALGDKFASRKLIMLQVIHTRSIASGQ